MLMANSQNMPTMRVIGILILISTSLMLFSPFSMTMVLSPESDIACIVTLDVCHATDATGSVYSDLPAFCEKTFSLAPLQSLQFIEIQNPLVLSRNIPFLEERPPRV